MKFVDNYPQYDDEYLSDYKELENFDPGPPFQDIPITESEDEEPETGPPPTIVPREAWGALPGGEQRLFTLPTEVVIYSYTETEVCTTKEQCLREMKAMQKKHMAEGYPDIKFNFVIGGDGNVYEGTGWKVRAPLNDQYPDFEGEHIEFAHTGYRKDFPTPEKVKLINRLYDFGVEKQFIAPDARVCIDYMWPTD